MPNHTFRNLRCKIYGYMGFYHETIALSSRGHYVYHGRIVHISRSGTHAEDYNDFAGYAMGGTRIGHSAA